VGPFRHPVTWLGIALCAVALRVGAQDPPAESSPTIAVDTGDDETPDAPQRLEDLVVTATKRERLQRSLPGSVDVVGGERLEASRAQRLADYLKLVPGVQYNDQGTQSSVPVIRGIATEIGFGSTAQTTGVYLDDMPFADLIVPLSLPDLHPFDLERVEVLKGPQGTLFGSGALAGAVRYVTRKPDPGLWQAKLFETGSRGERSDGDTRVTAAAVNAPLFGDAAAVRAVGVRRRAVGTYDMSARTAAGATLRDQPDADRSEQWSGRVLVGWQPSDRLGVTGLVFRQDTSFADVAFADQDREPASSRVPFASPRSYDFGGANLQATYDFDAARLVSSTNGLQKRNRILTHAEWLFDMQDQNLNEFYDLAVGEVRGVTQELRLSSAPGSDWSWLVGASYMRYGADYFQYEPQPGPAGTPPPDDRGDVAPAARAQSFLYATIDSVATETALFGEVTWPLTPAWELTAGARFYETRMDADTLITGTQLIVLTQQPETQNRFEPHAGGVNPKLALRYLYDDVLSLYVLAAKGFQFGGVQVNPSAPLLSQSAEQAGFHFAPYDSSELWNYEAGLRTEWLDGRLRFDLAAFYLDWRDLQLTVRVPVSGTPATFGVIANVGRAHSQGVEAALDVLPFESFRWTSAAAWIDAATDVAFDAQNPQGPVPAGTRLPGAPDFQWSNVLAYRPALPLLPEWGAGLELVHVHVGTASDAIRQTGTTGGYDAFDARLTLSPTEVRLQPELFLAVTNLMDVRGPTYHSRLASVSGQPVDFHHFVEPRTAMLGLRLQY
jgi:iron complex outermembrane receptor protein